MGRTAMCLIVALTSYITAGAQAVRAPKIWDDAALADWATPVAGLNVRPAHYSSAEYYSSPVDNLRTYPVYPPDREPAGYWEWLHQQKPEPLIAPGTSRSPNDWIAAGERAFREIDLVPMRTNDPVLIARLRSPDALASVATLPDGSFRPLRWVVTSQGVMLTTPACAGCHGRSDSRPVNREVAPSAPTRPPQRIPLIGPLGTARRVQQFYSGDPLPIALWKEFTVPWAPDERVERMKTMTVADLQARDTTQKLARSFERGMFARANGSPYYATKILDLENLRYSRYLDVTATHRLRGPEDVARYAALVTGADRMDFGPHRILSDEQRRVRFHYADEVLYSIGAYLMSLEPPKNPSPAAPGVVARGQQIFRREGCVPCHTPRDYTNGKLTLAQGWEAPVDHPDRSDIMPVSVGTDPGTALKTRKGTGLYKIPSLRGVWYRRLLLHDGSMTSLEELFDPARLEPGYVPTGWNPPGVTTRAVPGHTFGLFLAPDEKAALLAFLRSL